VTARVGAQLKAYQSTGETPFMWSLDLYGDDAAELRAGSDTLAANPGEVQKPSVVLECFYDDAEAYRQFSEAAAALPTPCSSGLCSGRRRRRTRPSRSTTRTRPSRCVPGGCQRLR
jgi:hypothetical protein